MTILTRWDPAREYLTLQDRMNRMYRFRIAPKVQRRP